MPAMLALTLVGAASIAFYVRFFVALSRESKPHVGGYWMRLRVKSDEELVAEQEKQRIIELPAA